MTEEKFTRAQELKSCPFCGSDNVKVHIPYFVDALYQIQCYNCKCTTALYKTEKEAIERWNTRSQVGEVAPVWHKYKSIKG